MEALRNFLKTFYSWLKTKSVGFIWIFLTLLFLLVGLIATSSCSRSTLRFKGTGDVEYYYKGANGPNYSTERSN